MGRDKALLMVEDEPLLNRQIRCASPYFSETILLNGPNRYDVNLRSVPDAINDAGPLSGLLAALKDAGSSYDQIAVIPVDLPSLSDETLARLATVSLSGGPDALLLTDGRSPQPLAGIYRTSVINPLQHFLDSGQRMVMKFLEQLQADHLTVPPEELTNINYPEDYRSL